MIDSIILGFIDIYKNKKIFVILELSILMMCFITISSSLSLISNILDYDSANTSIKDYQAIPISNDMSKNIQLSNSVYDVLRTSGKTYYYSIEFNEVFRYPTVILIDSNNTKLNQKQSTVFASESILKEVKQNSEYFPENVTINVLNKKDFDSRIYESMPDEQKLIVIQLNTEKFDLWIDTVYGDEIIELTENIKLDNNEEKVENELLLHNLYQDSFLSLKKTQGFSDENIFIFTYIYPTIMLMIIIISLSLIIVFSIFFKRLIKEYTIHFISGATFKHIFIRNSIFIMSLLFLSFIIIMCIDSFIFGLPQLIGCFILFIILVLTELSLFIAMKRKNILFNLKGDM